MTDIKPPRTQSTREQRKFREELCRLINKHAVDVPSDSTAATVADLRTDFNALLAALRTAFD